MTRPRAYQINDPGSHYARYQLPSTPSSTTMNLTGADYANFQAASASGTFGGIEESIPAVVQGTYQEPFLNILNGHQIGISMTGVNGGNVIPVTFQTSDFVTISGVQSLTAARAAARINAALATYGVTYAAATNNNGRLRIVSAVGSSLNVGDGVTVTLTESGFTPGTLQRLGFEAVPIVTSNDAGQQAGATAPVRGIITKSADLRGGYFPLRYANGEAVLTQTSQLVSWKDGAGKVRMWPNIVGGQTIYGRVSQHSSPPTVKLSFFANDYAIATQTSNGGDFASLSGSGHSFRIQVSGIDPSDGSTISPILVTVTFSGTYNTVADVVNAINTAWQAAAGSSAVAMSSMPEPYALEPTDTLQVYVNGTTMYSITFGTSAGCLTAQAVVDIINATAPGLASAVSMGGRNYVKLTATTSLQFLGSRTAINKIGFPFAKIVPSTIASVYGQSEMRFSFPFTDAASGGGSMTVNIYNFSGPALNVMGFTSPMIMTTASQEVEAQPTSWPDPAAGVGIVMLIPESLELGDVPGKEMTTLQQFMNQDTVQQTQSWAGSANANRPINYDRNGRIPANAVAGQIMDSVSAKTVNVGGIAIDPSTPRVTIPYVHSTGSPVFTLIYESDGVPTTAPPATTRNTFSHREYIGSFGVSNTSDRSSTWNARWIASTSKWSKDVAGKAASRTVADNNGGFRFEWRSPGDNTDWSDFNKMIYIFPNNSDGGPTLSMAAGGCLSSDSSLYFSDDNILSFSSAERLALSTGTASNGDFAPRVSEKQAFDIDREYSIIRSLNGRYHVTVGDGLNTFGDFNGANGLIDAVNFLQTSPIVGTRRATIHLKAGTYNGGIALTTSSLSDLEIIGPTGGDNTGSATCTIGQPSTNINTITMTKSGTVYGSLTLKNVRVEQRSSGGNHYYGVEVVGGAHLYVDRCIIQCVSVNNPAAQTDASAPKQASVLIRNSRLYGSPNTGGPGPVTVQNVTTTTSEMIGFEYCSFGYGVVEQQCVYVKASASISDVAHLCGLYFKNCKFNLSPGFVNSNVLTKNTGLLDLDPNGTNVRTGNGMVVDTVAFYDCDVQATYASAGWSNVLLHLLPTANGTAATDSGAFMYVDQLWFTRTRFNVVLNGGTVANTFTAAYGARLFAMDGCSFTFSSTTASKHGEATTDTSYAFTGMTTYNSAVLVSADDINVTDCEFSGFLHAGSASDTFWRYNRSLLFKNVRMSNYSSLAGSSGTVAGYRNIFQRWGTQPLLTDPGGTVYSPERRTTGLIDGLIMRGKKADYVYDRWNMMAFVLLDAEGIHMTNSSISGFQTNASVAPTNSGILVWVSTATQWRASSFRITNNVVESVYNGINAILSETENGAGPFWISQNTVKGCSYYGIVVSVDNLARGGEVSGNYVYGCTKAGIKYDYPCTPSSSANRLIIVRNTVKDNNGADPNWDPFDPGGAWPPRQVIIRPRSTSGTNNPWVVFRDNVLSYGGYSGSLHISRRLAGAVAVVPDGANSPLSCGYISGGHTGIYDYGNSYIRYYLKDDEEMQENQGRMQNNTSLSE